MSEPPLSGARVLVTGSAGFVGTHLVAALGAFGASVCGLDRKEPADVRGDLRSEEVIRDVLRRTRPTHVMHLAGVLGNAEEAETLYEENVLNTTRLLEAIRSDGLDVRILVASSSAVYGDTAPEQNPLDEDRPFRPISPYGVSKVAQEMAALQAHLAHRIWTVRVRTFNLVGPGQPAHLMLSDLARQVAEAECDGGPITVRVGTLAPRRDYTDVRDAARAYCLLADRGEPGAVYNVCAGRSYAVQECADLLTGLSARPVRVVQDQARVRGVEIPDQVGDAHRLAQATGWQPRIPLAQSVRDLLEEWRQRVRDERGVHA